MPDPTKPLLPTSAYWGAVLGATMQRASTADVFAAVRAVAENLGGQLSFAQAQEITTMRTQAVAYREAMANLMGAPTELGIDRTMIARTAYSRPPSGRDYSPIYQGRFQMTTRTPHGIEQGWYRIDYGSLLDKTVGDLMGDVALYASDLANEYSMDLVSVDAWSIEEI